jgi:hypothetical protein
MVIVAARLINFSQPSWLWETTIARMNRYKTTGAHDNC